MRRPTEALAAIDEAVARHRQFSKDPSSSFLPDLAMFLANQSNRLADLGRHEEALVVIEEAVKIRRSLAEADPDTVEPYLATALNNQSNRLADLGRYEEALVVIEEAVRSAALLPKRVRMPSSSTLSHR